jgi:hypothetical protein
VVRQIVGKRLTWDQLTGNVSQSQPSQAEPVEAEIGIVY